MYINVKKLGRLINGSADGEFRLDASNYLSPFGLFLVIYLMRALLGYKFSFRSCSQHPARRFGSNLI